MNFIAFFLFALSITACCRGLMNEKSGLFNSVLEKRETDDEIDLCTYAVRQLEIIKKENELLNMHFQMWNHRWNKLEGMVNVFEAVLKNIENYVTTRYSDIEDLRTIITNISSKECEQEDILPKISSMIVDNNQLLMADIDKKFEPLSQIKGLVITEHEGILRIEERLTALSDLSEKFLKGEEMQKVTLSEINATINSNHYGMIDAIDKKFEPLLQLQDLVTKEHQGISNIEKNLIIIDDLSKKLSDQILYLSYVKENQHLLTDLSTRLAKIEQSVPEIIDYDLYPSNCVEYDKRYCDNNLCHIKHPKGIRQSLLVSCFNHTIHGDGWLVIQKRMDGSVDFYRNWAEYKTGFGNISGEFWIGLDHLHALTTLHDRQELLIILEDFENVTKHVKYDSFVVGNEEEKYILKNVGENTGDAGVAFARHQGYQFTTIDNDNDIDDDNCARTRMGGWWYLNCFWCNLNGKYYSTGHGPNEALHSGISWLGFHDYDYSMKFVQMMIRPHRIFNICAEMWTMGQLLSCSQFRCFILG
uniref:Fibrinogen C-terminal domain-containing protein n=1 Tax=Glossina palpalis gambiensis TaxID=67801 RepID=A0A1B0ANK2_9MUSC